MALHINLSFWLAMDLRLIHGVKLEKANGNHPTSVSWM